MMDWQSSLQQFLADNPDLPKGDTTTPTPDKPVRRPRLDIILDRKGRAGKVATIITGFPDETPDSEIADIAASIKRRLGVGGSTRGLEILIQGDRRTAIADHLRTLGYPSRLL